MRDITKFLSGLVLAGGLGVLGLTVSISAAAARDRGDDTRWGGSGHNSDWDGDKGRDRFGRDPVYTRLMNWVQQLEGEVSQGARNGTLSPATVQSANRNLRNLESGINSTRNARGRDGMTDRDFSAYSTQLTLIQTNVRDEIRYGVGGVRSSGDERGRGGRWH